MNNPKFKKIIKNLMTSVIKNNHEITYVIIIIYISKK